MKPVVVVLIWLLLLVPHSALAQKKFDLDDFMRPDTPAANKPAVDKPVAPTAEPTSKVTTSAPSAKPTAAASNKSAVSSPTTPSKPAPAEAATEAGEAPADARRAKREATNAARAAETEERAAAARQRAADKDALAAERNATRKAAAEERAAAAKERAAAKVREKPKRVKKKTAYDLLSDEWHAPAPPELSAAHAKAAVPQLVFRVQKTGAIFVLEPASRAGGFDESQLAIAKEAFNSWGPTPHPRTLDLVYAATLEFNAPYVTLISGIRKDRGGSRHSHGLAADIVLPGIEDETLAAFFRAQGFCGVGTYPRSHFVHIDTRDQSYFWIDNSKPNQRGRVVQVRKEESTAADEAARQRGAGGFVNPPRLQKALNVRLVKKRKAHQAKLARAAAKAAASEVSTKASGPMPSSVTSEK